MSNSNAPFGFRPSNHVAGGTPARQSAYNIAYNYATAIYSGDLVRSTGTGRDIELVPDGTTARVLGVFAGCKFVDNNGEVKFLPYWPGTALSDTGAVVEAYVFDDPYTEFVAQITTIAAADVGQAYEWQNGTGSTRTGRSGGYVDRAQTGAPQIKIEGLAQEPDGITLSEYGAYAKVRCRILTHEKMAGSLVAQ
jgi:hypothetical protein